MNDRGSGFGDARGASRYLVALREHWLLIASLVLVSVLVAGAYSKTAQKRYEAESDILVSPIAGDDPAFLGFSLLRDTGGQARPVVTAARLVTTPQVADAVAREAGLPGRDAAVNSVKVTPLGQSNVVSIVGIGRTADRAAAIANAFAEQTIAQRTAQFQRELRQTIDRLETSLGAIPQTQRLGPQALALQQRLGSLAGLVGTKDPTLQLISEAAPPPGPVWPRPVVSVVVAFVAALLLGIGLALALELVSPRINREEELLLEQRLPILARVPRMPKRALHGYLSGREPLPGNAREAYRTLRASLLSAGRDGRFPQTVLVTSATPGEGKTMTSMNLAVTLAHAGNRVVLIDADLRRPMIATVFGIAGRSRGFVNVLLGESTTEEALTPAPGYGDELRLLLASPEHAHLVDLLDSARVEEVLGDLRLYADVVVIDSPPLTEVADALNLADAVDAIVVAVRLGHTRRDRLAELRRMLAQRGVGPAGFVVTTRRRSKALGYYYGHEHDAAVRADPTATPRERQPEPVGAGELEDL